MKRIAILALIGAMAVAAGASTNFPVTAVAPQVDPTTGIILWPTNWDTANSIARCPACVVALSNDCSGPWYSAGVGVLTNAAGWHTTGAANGSAVVLAATQYIWSVLSPAGYAGETNTHSGDLAATVEISPDAYSWTPAAYSAVPVYVRWSFATTSTVSLASALVYGWAQTSQVGRVQDFGGLTIRVDPPVGPRDAVPLQTLDSRISTNAISDLATAISNANATATNVQTIVTALLRGNPVVIGSGEHDVVSNSISIGTFSTTVDSPGDIAIGYGFATGSNSILLGTGVAQGPNSISIGGGPTVNANFAAAGAIAIGFHAQVNYDGVQLGTGLNNTAGSLQYKDWTIVNSSGNIPFERGAGVTFTNAWTDANGTLWRQVFNHGLLNTVYSNGYQVTP